MSDSIFLHTTGIEPMDPEQLSRIRESGARDWNRWRAANSKAPVDLSAADLQDLDLQGINLSRGPDGGYTNFKDARFDRAVLSRADFRNSSLDSTVFNGSDLNGAALDGVNASFAQFEGAQLVSASLEYATFNRSNFTKAVLVASRARFVSLTGNTLQRADLRNTDLFGATLTSTTWFGAKLNRRTNLSRVVFELDHDEISDGSDAIEFGRLDRWLNWSRLRWVAALPLFGVSYTTLVIAFAVVNLVGFVNTGMLPSIRARIDSGEFTPIPDLELPVEMGWIVVSSLLLAIGSTVYRLVCPASVQKFTEVEWVAQLRRPRLLYLRDSLDGGARWLKGLVLQAVTAICVLGGGSIAIAILFTRVVRLLAYLFQFGHWQFW
jgi:hypothetical protein